jgi:hypothetical protein
MATTLIVLVPGETSWVHDLMCEFQSGVANIWSYQNSEKMTRFQDAIRHEKKRRMARETHRFFTTDAEALDEEKMQKLSINPGMAQNLRDVRHLPYSKWGTKYKQIAPKNTSFENLFTSVEGLKMFPRRFPAVPEVLIVDHANDALRIQVIIQTTLSMKWKVEVFNVKIEGDMVSIL